MRQKLEQLGGVLLLVLLAWLLPQRASATYVDDTYRYQVMLSGANSVRISVPVYDQAGADCWVQDGNLKVTWKDANNTEQTATCFHWQTEGCADGTTELYVHFKTEVGGSFEVTRGNISSYFTMTKDDRDMMQKVTRNSDGTTFAVEAVWRVPFELRGKELKFKWDVERTGTSRGTYKVPGLNDMPITIPAAEDVFTPQVTMATISYNEAGKLEVPWYMASTKITAAKYEYTDHRGKEVSVAMNTDVNNGVISLDATEPYKNFRIVMSYKDNNDYDISNVSSTVQDLTMIHAPVGLSARPTGNNKAAVKLTWNTLYPDIQDITGADLFEVQRSLTGKDADFVTIGQVAYAFQDGERTFEYVDSTLIDAIKDGYLKGGTLDRLTYRVRRSITATWGWNDNNCAAQASCVVDDIHLLRIKSYEVKVTDEQAYQARVSWDYADEWNAVWDSRARMKVGIVMKNRDGNAVDSITYEVTADDRQKRYKQIDLSRSCVNFDIKLYVEKGTSPIPTWDEIEPFYFPIRNANDWVAFKDSVQAAGGKYDVNARLYADISTDECISADSAYAYRGDFDGNGHTLNFSKSGSTERAVAPFCYVGNATFHNLHTAGTISTNERNVAGLIGMVIKGSYVYVENCRSSVVLNTSYSGESNNGGFVGRLSGANIELRTCKFDGSFEGDNCYGNGGFIGWVAPDSHVSIVNSLFTPDHFSTKISKCATWACVDKSADANIFLKVNNSYATTEFTNQVKTMVIDGKTFMVLHNNSDWLKFKEALKTSPSTNAIMNADFTVTDCVADYGDGVGYFQGIFDGNGHTLTVNLNGDEKYPAYAPFRRTFVGCTIKNLHVAGSIKGPLTTAGIVGEARTTDIFNCRVSASIESTYNFAGGFVGRGEDGVSIQNCLFDGSVKVNPNAMDVQGEGAFIGYVMSLGGQSVTTSSVANCLARGTFEGSRYVVPVTGLNFKTYTWWGNGENSSTKNNWSYERLNGTYTVGTMNASDLVNRLGSSNWEVSGEQVVPKMFTTDIIDIVTETLSESDSLNIVIGCWTKVNKELVPATTQVVEPAAAYPEPQLPDFYHEGNGEISKELMTETRQSSVVLTWDVEGIVDYFQVWRRIEGSGEDAWQTIADQIDSKGYEDKSVSPLLRYEYKVRAVTDCEGKHYSDTQVKAGACKNSGRVTGYVRFNDGTGVRNIEVRATHQKLNDNDRTIEKTDYTDETGYFVIEGLPYNGLPDIEYTVTAVGTGATSVKFEVERRTVTFDDKKNDATTPEFTVTNSHRFSGSVLYDGTSIPVKGVHFKVDGHDVYNSSGELLETDFDGSYSFRVLDGLHTIQAWKDKHTFTEEGYYVDKNKNRNVDISVDEASIRFYDATKVKLIGRVVGGDVQGRKPLGNNLSENNLGENVTMIMALEGDNSSWLVYDNQQTELKTRTLTFPHTGAGGHQTTAVVERKRMVVMPDSATGEYTLMLPPVRWKVQSVSSKGYPTLFQDGQVSDVIDLTDCLTPKDTIYTGEYADVDGNLIKQPRATYNAEYSRIYHAPVEITYEQLGFDTFSYFGDKTYVAQTLGGDKSEVSLAYRSKTDSTKTAYTFGYPVFSLNRRYPIQISVVERYPWNNDPADKKKQTDVVHVGGGKVTIHDTFGNTATSPLQLDSLGQGIYNLKAEQTTRLLTGENALKTVTMTLTQDGTTYEAEPLRGYVLNMFALGGAKDAISTDKPLLIDILRDPPGSSSSATLSKGSKLKYNYTVDMKFRGGVDVGFGFGTSLDNYSGLINGGGECGTINSGKSYKVFDLAVIFSGSGKNGFSYTMNVGEDITTSSAGTMVGADADLYIGVVQNMMVTQMSTIRAIPDSIYRRMLARTGGSQITVENKSEGMKGTITSKYGTLVHIAEGRDANDSIYHLVRDVSLGYGPEVTSQFVHSQKYILSELLPKLADEILALLFIGSRDEAVKQANETGKRVYWSKVARDDANFGSAYEIIEPAVPSKGITDEIAQKLDVLKAWIEMVGQNEYEKLYASDLVAHYDVDGGSKISYNETFESEYSTALNITWPFYAGDEFNDNTGIFGGIGTLTFMPGLTSLIKYLLPSIGTISTHNPPAGNPPAENPPAENNNNNQNNNNQNIELNFSGKRFTFSITPVAEYSSVGTYGTTYNYTRKESFNISMDAKSHLLFDVYRVQNTFAETNDSLETKPFDVFLNDNFNEWQGTVLKKLRGGLDMSEAIYPRSFVYRTRGGATANTWENERRTQVYRPGTVLDERTKKISNPKITLDRQSVSGVAMGSPARFKVYLTNESEQPEAATGSLTMFTFYQDAESNPHGAKIFVDGAPLTGSGTTVVLNPGKVMEKTMEVYAGEEFDYEGLRIGVASSSDFVNTMNLATFDVHFLHEAGPVNIAVPSDKWVLNTNAQKNDTLGWYIPVTIDGFDKHQHNFDHIEFQYKESQRGEDSWTNLCSFYASDSLMAKASGQRKMIPENGNIKTDFYGEGTVMEKPYDLRAVLFCRNGNEFLTTSSKVISGVKDTRCPQLFGTPEPTSGLLKQGDNIVFNFSEDIEYNYLSEVNNFEVKGETNNNNITDAVSLQFMGQASLESEATRNFEGKNLTIDMMIEPDTLAGRDMPLFSHGTSGKKLQLWLTKDFRLKAVIDDNEYVSDSTIQKGIFTQVAVVIDQAEDSIAFYNGGSRMGGHKLRAHYSSTGKLIFGRTNEQDRKNSQFYKGRMMEARLWYRAMDRGLLSTTYGNCRLTGYEPGLVDYYPMNEGSGDYAVDKTQGANATLMGASWAVPRGYSLYLKNEGLELNQDALNRTKEQDYTLMFWFKTDETGRGVLVSNGSGKKDEVGAQNRFNIAFDAEKPGKLMYRSNGFETEVPGNWSDGQWHHYAMTVNRSANVANIYVDQVLRTTFSSDSLGAISGGIPMLGAAKFKKMGTDGTVATIDTCKHLTGYIDELCLFAQALPLSLINTYSKKSPCGDESGLLTYLAFERQERLKNNKIVTMPYAYSKKIYLDDNGNVRNQIDSVTNKPTDMPMRDYRFIDEEDVILQHITDETAAPVLPFEELENLKFSFVGEGHKLLVNIDESAAKLNRRNIYVTVRDVEDKHGNAMISPQTACYLVTNSSLQWLWNRENKTIKYGSSESIELMFFNNSAKSHTYTIENCPKWLMLDKSSDVIAPQDMDWFTATVSKDLNVGSYSEIIYLTDEDGISEPLYLNLTVEGEQPDWADHVNSNLLQYSMNIVGRVFINDEVDTDPRDIVGVFGQDNQCHGFARIDYSTQTGEGNIYLTVYDNQASGRDLYFKLWQYSTGRELQLTANGSSVLNFQNNAMIGNDTPVRFEGGNIYVQTFDLKEGWNWVSFYVASEQLFNLNNLLDGLPWKEGDVLTDMNSDLTLIYTNGHWIATENTRNVVLSPSKAYAIKVQEDIKFPVGGYIIKAEDDRTIELKPGWNGIGYTPMLNLPIETALTDYSDQAEPGDVIKSHTEFAYFTRTGGVGRWRGSLEYMKPGEGYMLLRKGTEKAEFRYPFYEPGSSFINAGSRRAAPARARSTMTVSTTVDGIELEEGDRLLAFANGERVGEAPVLSGSSAEQHELLYLSIAGDKQQGIWFAIERDGDIIAATNEQMTFTANAVVGSPDEPTVIRFVRSDYENGRWYTTSGIQLSGRPTNTGIYIYNGKKVVIK